MSAFRRSGSPVSLQARASRSRPTPRIAVLGGSKAADSVAIAENFLQKGVEKILEFELTTSEKKQLDNTLKAVKKTVKETKL